MTREDHHHDCGDGADRGDGVGRRAFVGGCGAAMAFALAGTSLPAAAQDSGSESAVATLLEDKRKDWGRFGEDDELGRLNLLGSAEAFDGMVAATQQGRKGIERFTLQLSQTGEVIDPDGDDDGTTTGRRRTRATRPSRPGPPAGATTRRRSSRPRRPAG